MTPELKHKIILFGTLSILAVALLVTLAVPAMAAPPGGKPQGGPGVLPSKDFATLPGILTASGTSITVTKNSSSSVTWSGPAGAAVTIVYNNNGGKNVVQGIMLNPPAQAGATPKIPPKIPPNMNIATVQGTLTASGTGIIITETTVNLNGPESAPVAIIYNSSTDAVQGIMLKRPGQPNVPPRPRPNQNFAAVLGTLTVTGTSIDITPNSASSITWSGPSSAAVTIVYSTINGMNVVRGIMLNWPGQAGVAPKIPPNRNIAIVQGTLTATGTGITITTSVALGGPQNAAVTIIYNKSGGTNVVQGIMLKGLGRFPFPPKYQPNKNSNSLNNNRPLGPMGSFGQQGINWIRAHMPR